MYAATSSAAALAQPAAPRPAVRQKDENVVDAESPSEGKKRAEARRSWLTHGAHVGPVRFVGRRMAKRDYYECSLNRDAAEED